MAGDTEANRQLALNILWPVLIVMLVASSNLAGHFQGQRACAMQENSDE